MVKDIYPGEGDSVPRSLAALGRGVYFGARDAEHGCSLWRSDGTANGTRPIFTFLPICDPLNGPAGLIRVGDILLFTANDGTRGRELWRTDGTAAGTRIVRNITTTPDEYEPGRDRGSDFSALTPLGATLLFALTPDDRSSGQLWRSDGTEEGTYLVKEVDAFSLDRRRPGFHILGDIAVFGADGPDGAELWRTDGTDAGTYQIASYPFALAHRFHTAVLHNELYLPLFRYPPASFSLWKTDGTSLGTIPIVEDVPLEWGYAPEQLTASGELVYFTAATSRDGMKLWATDGTPAGTRQVADLNTGHEDYFYDAVQLSDLHGTLFFLGTDDNGCGLWTSRGTADTTQLVEDLNPGSDLCPQLPDLSTPQGPLVATNGRIMFGYDDGVHGGHATYVSDGTAAGTYVLNGIVAPPCSGDCDASGAVSVSEIVQAVNMALGSSPVDQCTSVDGDGDNRVTINELVAVVSAALEGCG